jgi:hypothetical protein
MALDPIEALLRRIRKGGHWPPESEVKAWRAVKTWRAFLEADRPTLKRLADWTDDGREMKVDPLPERIAEAWADHLFGEELTVTAANDQDTARLEELIDENDLTEEARAAEREFVIAEGEGWWRVYVDEEVADVPLLEWHSRASVAPLFIGPRLKAVALISVLEGPGNTQGARNAIYRHFEIHADARVLHVVHRGTKDRLGGEVPLEDHPDTEELALTLGDGQQWEHGLPMLMGRIVNRRARDPRLGRSEYDGIRDYLMDLNEAVTIAAENARLTAKKRVVVPEGALRRSPAGNRLAGGADLVDRGDGQLVPRAGGAVRSFDAGEDVLVADPLDAELGKAADPFRVLEYSFDADALIAHKRDLIESAVTRVGLTPQWIGIRTGDGDGYAASGTALRLRLIPTDKGGRGKARAWDRELPRILSLLQQIDALPEDDGGLGNGWAEPEARPTVSRANPLPVDELEEAQVEATLVGAGARSVETSVRRQHPAWSDDEVRDEVARIKAEKPAGGIPGLA